MDPAGPPPGLLCVVTTWGAWVGGFALSAGGREVERAEELAPQVPGAALTRRWTGLGAQPAFSPQADPPGACAPQSLQWTASQLPSGTPQSVHPGTASLTLASDPASAGTNSGPQPRS